MSEAQIIANLAMLLRRLIYRARRHEDCKAICDDADDYLKRNNLQGSPMR